MARHTADLSERYLDHLQDMAHVKFLARSTEEFVVRDPAIWKVCSGLSSSVVIQQAMTTLTLLQKSSRGVSVIHYAGAYVNKRRDFLNPDLRRTLELWTVRVHNR